MKEAQKQLSRKEKEKFALLGSDEQLFKWRVVRRAKRANLPNGNAFSTHAQLKVNN